jgi:hypothetical protein
VGLPLSTFRLRFALLAAAILSALTAAEGTLASAPMFDVADRDWPAQLTPVKDRDSVNQRTARATDHPTFEHKVHQHTGGDSPAHLIASFELGRHDRVAAADVVARTFAAPPRLMQTLIDLPPPLA